MTDDAELHIVETAPVADDGSDIIPGRTPRPPVRWPVRPSWLVIGLALALLAGIGIGYLIGRSDRGKHVAAPSTASPPGWVVTTAPLGSALDGLALRAGETCFGRDPTSGKSLMVGVNLADQSGRPVVLTGLHGVFPLGGLRQVGSQVGQCDNNATEQVSGHRIEPSATVWLSLMLDVQVRCPGSLPVQFRLEYTIDGRPATQTVNPFPDLSGAPYPGCATSAHR